MKKMSISGGMNRFSVELFERSETAAGAMEAAVWRPPQTR
jgi:hypothetical protein